MRADLGHRLRLVAGAQDRRLFGRPRREGDAGRAVQQGLQPKIPSFGTRAPTRHDERAHHVVAVPAFDLGHETSNSFRNSATSSGVSILPARSTSNVVW